MNSGAARILIAEDNDADVFLVRTSLEEAGFVFDLRVASDGEEVLRLVDQADASAPGGRRSIFASLNILRNSWTWAKS
jgi:CheY-like chemotaxis protein